MLPKRMVGWDVLAINHCRTAPNLHTKVYDFKGLPHLVLHASRRIKKGEELLFDYGERSSTALSTNPWLIS